MYETKLQVQVKFAQFTLHFVLFTYTFGTRKNYQNFAHSLMLNVTRLLVYQVKALSVRTIP